MTKYRTGSQMKSTIPPKRPCAQHAARARRELRRLPRGKQLEKLFSNILRGRAHVLDARTARGPQFRTRRHVHGPRRPEGQARERANRDVDESPCHVGPQITTEPRHDMSRTNQKALAATNDHTCCFGFNYDARIISSKLHGHEANTEHHRNQTRARSGKPNQTSP